jgi:hypothetical protein
MSRDHWYFVEKNIMDAYARAEAQMDWAIWETNLMSEEALA